MKTKHTAYASIDVLPSGGSLSSSVILSSAASPHHHQEAVFTEKIFNDAKPSHLAMFMAYVVFLKEGAKKDWEPPVPIPCYSSL